MHKRLKWMFEDSSFNLNTNLVDLWNMIKAFSLKLSREARERLAWMDCYRECGNAAPLIKGDQLKTVMWNVVIEPMKKNSIQLADME